MKAHISVDRKSGMVHTVLATAANEHNITCTSKLLHGASVPMQDIPVSANALKSRKSTNV
jgi:IS5 family transposase